MAFLGLTYRGILTSGVNLGFGGITRRRSSYTPEAIAYFSAVESAGGTLTDNVKAEFNAFVVREKDAGRWDKIKRLYPFLGGKIASAVIDAVTTTSAVNANNNFTDADVDATVGLQGDGSTKYLRLGFIPDGNISASKFAVGIAIKTAGTNTTVYHGVRSDSSTRYLTLLENNASNAIAARTNSGAQLNGLSPRAASGDIISVCRESSTLLSINRNSTLENTRTTSDTTALPTTEMFFGGYSNNGAPFLLSDSEFAGHYIAEFDNNAETQAFDTSYKTFINNITTYAASQAYFNAVATAGGTLTDNVKSEFTSFVTREVENNRWNKIKRLYPYLGGVINSAIIDAVTLASATNNNFVDADVDTLVGLQGDGSTKSILESQNTNIILSTINHGAGVIFDFVVANPNAFQGIVGFYDSSNTTTVSLQFDTLDRIRFYTPALPDQVLTTSTSFDSIIGWRESSTLQKLAVNDSITINTTSASTSTLSSVKIGYFGRSFNGTVFNQNALKYLCSFIEEGMNESEILAFRTSYKTFITNIKIAANGWWDGSQTGMLDDYPSASAAYSVRALNSAYTGPLLRVRRSSDNAEQDIYAKYDGNLDTASLLTFVGAGDGFVVTWYDQSGNVNNATQPIEVNQPQIVFSGAVRTKSSKPSIFWPSTSGMTYSSINVSNQSIFFVYYNAANITATTPFKFILDGTNATLTLGSSSGTIVDERVYWSYPSPLRSVGQITADIPSGGHIQTLTYNSSTFIDRMWRDGAEYTLTDSSAGGFDGSLFPTGYNKIGRSSLAGGINDDLAELIIYPADQSSNQLAIESNINTYYSIY